MKLLNFFIMAGLYILKKQPMAAFYMYLIRN